MEILQNPYKMIFMHFKSEVFAVRIHVESTNQVVRRLQLNIVFMCLKDPGVAVKFQSRVKMSQRREA